MTSQKQLAVEFARGATTGQASNVQIKENGSGTHLVGYGWAIYATRTESGQITVYDGWSGYSVSTTQQLGKIRRGIRQAGREFETSEEDPQL